MSKRLYACLAILLSLWFCFAQPAYGTTSISPAETELFFGQAGADCVLSVRPTAFEPNAPYPGRVRQRGQATGFWNTRPGCSYFPVELVRQSFAVLLWSSFLQIIRYILKQDGKKRRVVRLCFN